MIKLPHSTLLTRKAIIEGWSDHPTISATFPPVILTLTLYCDLNIVRMNQVVRYLVHKSPSSEVIVRTSRHTAGCFLYLDHYAAVRKQRRV